MRLFLLFLLFLSACTSEKEKPLLNPSNLEGYFVKVSHEKDQMISTPKGAVVRIKKGTFAKDVELEIKEAYTMKDIMLGGLVTTTNGKPLRSGGMIYINERDGNEIEVLQPIDVILPTNYVDENMKLYKGEFSEYDSLTWVEIDTLQPTALDKSIEAGKQIYLNSCHSCHGIRVPLSGPALAGVWDRGPWKEDRKNLLQWVNNPGAFIPTTGYTRNLQRTWGSIMPSYPQLKESDIVDVMNFIKNEAASSVTDTFVYKSPIDSSFNDYAIDTSSEISEPCVDTSYYEIVDEIEPVNESTAINIFNDSLPPIETSFRSGFTDQNFGDGRYRFQIQTLGWYNVDAELDPLPSTTLCHIAVELTPIKSNLNMNVYAFFPAQKNLSVGSKYSDQYFSFKKIKDSIPLYIGEEGIIVAFGNERDNFYYGTSRFKVKKDQRIVVTVSASTEEALLNAIKNEKLEGINMDIIRREMEINPCGSKSGSDTTITL